jgi:hypothetical protein
MGEQGSDPTTDTTTRARGIMSPEFWFQEAFCVMILPAPWINLAIVGQPQGRRRY